MGDKTQTTKNLTPIKVRLTIFIFVMIVASNAKIQSQVISMNDVESRAYSIDQTNSNESIVAHSQKILQTDDSAHVVLTSLLPNSQSRFYLIEKGLNSSKYVNIPIEYKVMDFAILGNTLYFCGYQTLPNSTLTSGFIAYIRINEMFNSLSNLCKYSNINSVLGVYKIKTYYNNNNERMVVGIGSQYFGDVICKKYDVIVDDDPILGPFANGLKGSSTPQTKISGYDSQGNVWTDEPKKYYDCFISYKVVDLPSNNGVDNYYDIYRCHFGNTFNNAAELLRDITITDDYICLVSNYYPNQPGVCNPANIFIIRRIDKNNFANEVVNGYNAAPCITSQFHDFTSVKLENLSGNDIALVYIGTTPANLRSNVIYKIDLSTNPFTNLLSSVIDENPYMRPYLWDLEYIKEKNQLLILKQQSNSNINNPIYSDNLYYINMDNNISYPYTTIAMDIPYSTYNSNSPVYWNSILRYNQTHFALVGNNKNINIYEKDIDDFFLSGGCNKLMYPNVNSISSPLIASSPWNLAHCSFIYMPQYHIQAYSLPSLVSTSVMQIPAYKISPINKYCENEKADFHFPKIEFPDLMNK